MESASRRSVTYLACARLYTTVTPIGLSLMWEQRRRRRVFQFTDNIQASSEISACSASRATGVRS